jgi:peptide subunit release factor 1 (eRF1)
MSKRVCIDESGRYGVIIVDPEATTVAIYNDEKIEEKLDAPKLELPDGDESMSNKEVLKQKIGDIHIFLEEVGKMAINLLSPIEDELDGILIIGPSPIKYYFDEHPYLGELHYMAEVGNRGPLKEHPLADHVDDDKTIAEQLNS